MSENFFLYAPAPESTTVVDVAAEHGLFIDGTFVPARSGYFPSINPATGETLSMVGEASNADVDAAVRAARRCFENVWGPMRPVERAKYLYRLGRLLQERAREFAVLETLDNGKPIRETRDVDVPLAAAHLLYHAGWADKLNFANLGSDPKPHGVVAQVIPWNFPLLMLAWKIAPALATGNTVVIKPAETTSLSALLFAELCQQAGLPEGAVNVVTGSGDVGAYLSGHRGLDKVAFTGSTEVGRRIATAAARTRRPVTLELGGKGANIVFDDAALDQTVEGIVNGIFFNQGHVCCAGSRLLVQESIHDEVVDRLRERMSRIRVGDPLDKNTDLGAINSGEQLKRITELVSAGESEGASRWTPPCELPTSGFWFPPTLLLDTDQSMRVVREEIFGPVLAVSTFRTPSEAIDKANNTPYGLSTGIWTEKGSKAAAVAERLRAGVIWTNTFNKFDPSSPFGGFKESGWGREGGLAGLRAYVKEVTA